MSALHQKSKHTKAVPQRNRQKITDVIPSVPCVAEIIQQETRNVVSDTMCLYLLKKRRLKRKRAQELQRTATAYRTKGNTTLKKKKKQNGHSHNTKIQIRLPPPPTSTRSCKRQNKGRRETKRNEQPRPGHPIIRQTSLKIDFTAQR
ncbi:hypothetical protein HPB48_010702 [Haemaphysalis longicornis]|uniref:Uncharacterized protein n=1 Tax=Haemaphysalis longicornis TaxID=44386 RepID=A0A9J6GBC2_HAELO|nr:hypothetical protein HPB48_010702 [Haemaphysalis longicornis]